MSEQERKPGTPEIIKNWLDGEYTPDEHSTVFHELIDTLRKETRIIPDHPDPGAVDDVYAMVHEYIRDYNDAVNWLIWELKKKGEE